MSGSPKPQVVLLCAAPGTQLTAIAKSLKGPSPAYEDPALSSEGPLSTVHVWDLESRICDHYEEEADGDVTYTMYEVVQLPRQELYNCWKKQYRKILDNIGEIEENKDAESREAHVVCMHLTWYNSTWKEFFSPVNILTLANENFPICHVVVLIDDIYDMFRRLQRPQSLYDRATMKPTERLVAKLSMPVREPPEGLEAYSHGSLRPEGASAGSDAAPASNDDEPARIPPPGTAGESAQRPAGTPPRHAGTPPRLEILGRPILCAESALPQRPRQTQTRSRCRLRCRLRRIPHPVASVSAASPAVTPAGQSR